MTVFLFHLRAVAKYNNEENMQEFTKNLYLLRKQNALVSKNSTALPDSYSDDCKNSRTGI